jgi:hypothetical protein
MDRRWNKTARTGFEEDDEILDLDSLLHPGRVWEHPSQVVNDPNLTLNEKRAILASWASDACAIEAAPGLRRAPGSKSPVRFDDVMEALSRSIRRLGNNVRIAHGTDASFGKGGQASRPIRVTGTTDKGMR